MPVSGNKPGADVTNRTVDRRQFLLGCASFAAAAGMDGVAPVNAAQAQQPPTAPSRPNILFMLGDKVGYRVLSSYHGGIADTPTPRIDSRRRRAADELQRRKPVHAEPCGNPDRPSADPLRHRESHCCRRPGRRAPVRNHACGNVGRCRIDRSSFMCRSRSRIIPRWRPRTSKASRRPASLATACSSTTTMSGVCSTRLHRRASPTTPW